MDADIYASINDTEETVSLVSDILEAIYGYSRINIQQTVHGEPTIITAQVWGEMEERAIPEVTQVVEMAISLAHACEAADIPFDSDVPDGPNYEEN